MDKIINLYYIICQYQNKDIYNVGDVFGRYLVENIINNKIRHTYQGDNVFQMVGSILRDSMKDSIILGTGILNKKDKIKCFQDCHMVRGKISLNILKQSCPDYDYSKVVLGDPGLVLSFFVDKKVEKIYEYGVVLHYIDDDLISEYFTDECLKKILIINVNNPDILDFSSQIMSCKKILSSSLHGIIFSHSLGLDVSWIRLDKSKLPTDDIKYYDYLSIFEVEGNLCNIIKTKLEYKDLLLLKLIGISQYDIDKKKYELFNHIIFILSMYGYDITKKFHNNIYDDDIGIQVLCKQISNQDKFCISRIGGIEYDAYGHYLLYGYDPNSIFYKNMFKYCGYYDLDNKKNIYDEYMIKYQECLRSSSLIMVANSKLESSMKFLSVSNQYFMKDVIYPTSDNILSTITHIPKISYGILESFNYFGTFYPMLDNKKILIISPFEEEIRLQLEIKDQLFDKNIKYPNFAKVEYINTYLTTNNYTTPHRNWKETYNYYKDIINTKDFEICLLICGAYAYPLSNYIYNTLNKSCIHIGGIGQLFFGIRGGRYNNLTYFTRMMNDNWIYPHQIINKNSDGVENYDGLLGYFGREI